MAEKLCERKCEMANEGEGVPFFCCDEELIYWAWRFGGGTVAQENARKLAEEKMVEISELFRKQFEEERKAAEWKWKGCALNTGVGEGERVPIDDCFEQIIISAERYALGRMTGIVSLTIRYIMLLLPRLSDSTLAIVLKDINAHEREGKSFGMDFDKAKWQRLREAIKKELENRKNG